MSKTVYFRADALDDAEQAQTWYETRKEGLGQRFALMVIQATERIEQWPMARAIIWKELRGYRIEGFPYILYYRIRDDHIEVVALLHGARDDKAWKARLDK